MGFLHQLNWKETIEWRGSMAVMKVFFVCCFQDGKDDSQIEITKCNDLVNWIHNFYIYFFGDFFKHTGI